MKTSPAKPTTTVRRRTHIVAMVAAAVGIAATSCGTVGATNNETTTTHGYSYYHDSRINETREAAGPSADHDSRITETPTTSP